MVFNLCEGYRESSAGEYGVAALLELLGLPYTGSGALALGIALNKPLAKEVFIARAFRRRGLPCIERCPLGSHH